MFVRYESPVEPFCTLNLMRCDGVRVVPELNMPADEVSLEEVDDHKTGRYAIVIDMDFTAARRVSAIICENLAEANMIGEALQAAMSHGCQFFDFRIAQAYVEEARRKGFAAKLELKYLVACASKLTWDEFQDRVLIKEGMRPPTG